MYICCCFVACSRTLKAKSSVACQLIVEIIIALWSEIKMAFWFHMWHYEQVQQRTLYHLQTFLEFYEIAGMGSCFILALITSGNFFLTCVSATLSYSPSNSRAITVTASLFLVMNKTCVNRLSKWPMLSLHPYVGRRGEGGETTGLLMLCFCNMMILGSDRSYVFYVIGPLKVL